MSLLLTLICFFSLVTTIVCGISVLFVIFLSFSFTCWISRYYYCCCPNSRPLPSIVTLCSFFKQNAVNCRFKNVINSLRGRAFPFNEKNRLARVKYQSALLFSGWNSRLSYGHSIQGRRKLVEVRRLGAIFMSRMGVFR